jgi:hypothetical protein
LELRKIFDQISEAKIKGMIHTFLMKEKRFLKISIVCSISGVVILFLLANVLETKEKSINKLPRTPIDEQISLTGKIEKISGGPGYSVILLS